MLCKLVIGLDGCAPHTRRNRAVLQFLRLQPRWLQKHDDGRFFYTKTHQASEWIIYSHMRLVFAHTHMYYADVCGLCNRERTQCRPDDGGIVVFPTYVV